MLVLAGLALISFIAFVAGVVDKACDATLIGIVLVRLSVSIYHMDR